MNQMCRISDNTETYLREYREILQDMIQGISQAELTDSISHNFIVQMIPHHEAAIRMSENLLSYTINLPLQEIAQNIVAEQTKGIRDMEEILETCGTVQNTAGERDSYQSRMDRIFRRMFRAMEQACADNQIDRDFIREMIPHHEGAVRMSETALEYGICPELAPVLEQIITTQKRGICQMRRLYCAL